MRWKLICGLGATGVLLAPLGMFAQVTLAPLWVCFAAAFCFAAIISRNTTSRRGWHGFLVGLLFFAAFGAALGLLWAGEYVWVRLSGSALPHPLPRAGSTPLMITVALAINGVVSGIFLGSLTWMWSWFTSRLPTRNPI